MRFFVLHFVHLHNLYLHIALTVFYRTQAKKNRNFGHFLAEKRPTRMSEF